MSRLLVLAVVSLPFAACVPMSGGSGGAEQQAMVATGSAATCPEDRFAVVLDGRSVEAVARSCTQPDGSIAVTQETPGLPTQTYVLAAATEICGTAGQKPCTTALTSTASGCRDYSVPVVVDGATLNATRRACPQPDGSWVVTQTVPGMPVQSYTLPASAPAYAYPAYGYYPYWWGYDAWAFPPPFFFARFGFFDRDHHRFRHFDGDHDRGRFGHDGGFGHDRGFGHSGRR